MRHLAPVIEICGGAGLIEGPLLLLSLDLFELLGSQLGLFVLKPLGQILGGRRASSDRYRCASSNFAFLQAEPVSPELPVLTEGNGRKRFLGMPGNLRATRKSIGDENLAVDIPSIVRDSPPLIKCAHHQMRARTPQFNRFVGTFVGMRCFQ
jgi:hypothetical protein